MTWEEKLMACEALGPKCQLIARKPGDWYVSQSGVHIRAKHLTSASGNGATPEAAAEDHFKILTVLLKPHECVEVIYCGKMRRVIWNGFMWADASEDPKA